MLFFARLGRWTTDCCSDKSPQHGKGNPVVRFGDEQKLTTAANQNTSETVVWGPILTTAPSKIDYSTKTCSQKKKAVVIFLDGP